MAKKFGKLLMVTAALGAVAGGVYYYLKGKDDFLDDDFFDDDDDFDNFDDDMEESDTERNYVDLDLGKAEGNDSKEEFKEGIQAAKAEATDKVVGGVKKVEEFFDDDDSDGSMDAM